MGHTYIKKVIHCYLKFKLSAPVFYLAILRYQWVLLKLNTCLFQIRFKKWLSVRQLFQQSKRKFVYSKHAKCCREKLNKENRKKEKLSFSQWEFTFSGSIFKLFIKAYSSQKKKNFLKPWDLSVDCLCHSATNLISTDCLGWHLMTFIRNTMCIFRGVDCPLCIK